MSLHQKHHGLVVRSSVLSEGEMIPLEYTCDGENINPPLTIDNVPEETKSLVLIVDDPDAPGKTWVHWVVWNINPKGEIAENSVPGVEGINDFGRHSYGGPCPPSGVHRYFFKVYALNITLDLKPNSTKNDVRKVMHGNIISEGELICIYKRH
ncbi:MAG: YbhB/YbcL family Raf kinase inhibitor-like protein [archaeon]